MTMRFGTDGTVVYVTATSAETIANALELFGETGSAASEDPSPTGYYTTTNVYNQTWEHPIDLNTMAAALSRLDPADVKTIIDIMKTNARSLEDHLDSAYLKKTGGTVYGETVLAGPVNIKGNLYLQGVPSISVLVPTGTIMAWGGDDYPVSGVPGYLLCDGQEYSTTEYENLYYVIADTYGSSGAGYFNVPDLTAEYAPYNNISGWYMIKT